MREILFKAKRIDNGELVEGFLLIKHYQELPHDRFAIRYKTKGDEYEWTPKYLTTEIDPETVCQYTELSACWNAFDNEPQEQDVWEHDLLEVDYNGKKVIAEVKYENSMYILASNAFVDSYIPLFDVVEIEDGCAYINAEHKGNIFDNQELIGRTDF